MNKMPQGLTERGKVWALKPAIMVQDLFGVTPDPWQEEALNCYAAAKRLAMKANKGPGKSAVLAWISWNFLLTRKQPNIIATSVSGDNLKDGLWKELSLWYGRCPLLKEIFTVTTTRIEAKPDPRNWFMSARTWPKKGSAQEQADSLAGFHSDNTLAILDEAGGIPDGVMAAAEATMAGQGEHHIIIAGNPTHREGPLFRACTTESRLWKVITITGDPDNPMRSPRVPIEWCREQIEKYGKDHPYVLVNVFGEFPPHSFNALIGDDEVAEAQKRMYRSNEMGANYARVMGIDVARGGPDKSVISRRHGYQMYPFLAWRNVESGQVGARLANRYWEEFMADAAFIDATGGFGLTWYDCLRDLGKAAIPIAFNGNATQSERYANKRAEMYFEFIQWIKNGGALPPADTEEGKNLGKALVNTTFTFKKDQLILEDKELIKSKIGFSPDEADSAALTFAEPVRPRQRPTPRAGGYSAVSPYQPFAEIDRMDVPRIGATSRYDPFSG